MFRMDIESSSIGPIGHLDPICPMLFSINAHSCRRRELPEWPHATYAIPRIFIARLLAFAFISLEKTRDKGLTSQRSQSHTTGFAVIDNKIPVVEFDNLDYRAGLRRIISYFVAVIWRHRFRTRKPHQRIAVSRSQINLRSQQLFHRKASVLGREF